MDTIEARIRAIETTMARMADTIDLVARMDERLVQLLSHKDDTEARLRALETSVAALNLQRQSISKAWWIILAAIVGLGFGAMKDRVLPPPSKPEQVYVERPVAAGE